jgi:hypothetical protein
MAMKIICGSICTALCFVLDVFADDHDPEHYLMTKTITFERPLTYTFASNYPAVVRVNLDLSLDGGSNWHRRIAHGIPAHWGSNSYEWSFLVTPDLWTERARIAVRSLWSSTTNAVMLHEGDASDSNFAICGVRIVSPTNNETVLQPGYKQITWHEAGATSVDIGVSTNGGVSYTRLYTVNSPLPTNSWSVPIMGFSTGRLDFVVQSVGLTDLWDSVTVKVQNQ